jgi:hypothetical protein
MPQMANKEIFSIILRSTIDVIGRRTSEAYANVVICSALNELKEKYDFLQYIEIKGTQYNEIFDTVDIKQDINNFETKEVGEAAKFFIKKIIGEIGKSAGYYFLREIKEDIPYDYEQYMKEIGVDFDFLQLQFITEIKTNSKMQIENSDVLKFIFKTLFDILDREIGRDSAYITLSEYNLRLSTKYEVLKYIKINDIRVIQGIEVINVDKNVDSFRSTLVGTAIQKIIQELNFSFIEQGNFSIIEKLKDRLNADYIFKLGEMGVDLNVIQLKQSLIVKHVIKALIDIVNETTTQSYAVLMVNNMLKKHEDRFEYLKLINIDSSRFSEDIDAIIVPEEIEKVRESELGRGLQKVMETLIKSLGDEAGRNFVDKFKKRLGKAYILRIEEIGVNLHMMELRENLGFNL